VNVLPQRLPLTNDQPLAGARGPLITLSNPQTAKRELRVLHVFSVLGVGGAETWLLSLLKYFREHRNDRSVQIDVLLTGEGKGTFDDEARALGAELFYVPFTRANVPRFVRAFRRILKRGNYDAIHDHQDYIAGLHFMMGLGQLPPVRVAHVHNPLYHRTNYANGNLRRLAQAGGKKLLSKFASHVMGTSQQIVQEYGLAGPAFRKVTTGAAHCGFEVENFAGDRALAHETFCRELGWETSSRVILFVGRLDGSEIEYHGRRMSHKNPEFALSVVRECMAADPTVRLAMVGAGDARRVEFEAMVQGWKLADKIRFLGARHDVPQLMLGADLLLFPSLAEGLGMVVVEAQAAGLRTLASDTTPRECLVIPGMVQFLPLTDESHWVTEALRLLDTDQDVSQCNAAVNRSPFSIRNSAARLLGIYSDNGN
jgi:glycosyltransferase involved in cell wall biosynthesis